MLSHKWTELLGREQLLVSSAPSPGSLNPIPWLWEDKDAILGPCLVESVFYSTGFWLNRVVSVWSFWFVVEVFPAI